MWKLVQELLPLWLAFIAGFCFAVTLLAIEACAPVFLFVSMAIMFVLIISSVIAQGVWRNKHD